MINPVGYVTMLSLCSQPVDHDDNGVRKVAEGGRLFDGISDSIISC